MMALTSAMKLPNAVSHEFEALRGKQHVNLTAPASASSTSNITEIVVQKHHPALLMTFCFLSALLAS
jgi:hypothetical protein